jgi:thiol:disulfide interchange protein
MLQAYRATTAQETSVWQKNYAQAHEQALAENKKILLDFTARWCSSCHEVQKKILANMSFDQLGKFMLPVIVDCTNLTAEPCASLQEKYGIKGLPAIVLIDPASETVIERWGAELLDGTVCDFVIELKQLMGQ